MMDDIARDSGVTKRKLLFVRLTPNLTFFSTTTMDAGGYLRNGAGPDKWTYFRTDIRQFNLGLPRLRWFWAFPFREAANPEGFSQRYLCPDACLINSFGST